MKIMQGFLYGHYDSRGGGTFIRAKDRRDADLEYGTHFGWDSDGTMECTKWDEVEVDPATNNGHKFRLVRTDRTEVISIWDKPYGLIAEDFIDECWIVHEDDDDIEGVDLEQGDDSDHRVNVIRKEHGFDWEGPSELEGEPLVIWTWRTEQSWPWIQGAHLVWRYPPREIHDHGVTANFQDERGSVQLAGGMTAEVARDAAQAFDDELTHMKFVTCPFIRLAAGKFEETNFGEDACGIYVL